MNLLHKYINRTDYDNYGEFAKYSKLIIPENFNYGYDVVDEYARLCPDKRALVWCNKQEEEKIITFGELRDLSNKAANLLISSGMKKGDLLMTMLNRRYEFWILAVAAHKLGVIIVPATFLLAPKDIVYRANTAGIKCIIAINEDEVTENISQALTDCPTVKTVFSIGKRPGFRNFTEEFNAASPVLKAERCTVNSDDFLIYFTSGTTGNPKMVTHNQIYPLSHIFTAKFWQDVRDDGLHFTMAETGWAKCSWGKIYGQWIAGSAIFVYDYYGKFTPTDVLPVIAKYKVTTFCAPPTIYRFLIQEDLSKYDFSSIKHCSTAGEPLNAEVQSKFMRMTGLEIKEGFGQSESAILVGTFTFVTAKPGSMGKPCPLYDIFLGDDDCREVAPGEQGEILLRNPEGQLGLLVKYYNDPSRTEQCLRGPYYHTGDLAYRDSDGYYYFVGRKDDIIKSSGYRIGPFEVESALMEHPAVAECAITGVPDPLRGQIVKATIILARGYEGTPELIKELQQHVKQATAPYKYPRVIEFVKEMPKTISGKIKRNEIRNKDSN